MTASSTPGSSRSTRSGGRPRALDPHLRAGVDHHLGDGRIGEPALERPEPEHGADGCAGRGGAHRDTSSAVSERTARAVLSGRRAASKPASTARATCGSQGTVATTGRPIACSTSRARSALPGSATSTAAVAPSDGERRPPQRQVAAAHDEERVVDRRRSRRLGDVTSGVDHDVAGADAGRTPGDEPLPAGRVRAGRAGDARRARGAVRPRRGWRAGRVSRAERAALPTTPRRRGRAARRRRALPAGRRPRSTRTVGDASRAARERARRRRRWCRSRPSVTSRR